MYHYKEEKEPVTHHCDAPDCLKPAEYRAPKTRDEEPEYFWFCLEHVREFNQSWNYFDGMSEEEIVQFQKDAAFGHRPTWLHQLSPKLSEADLRTKLQQFFRQRSGATKETYTPPVRAHHRKALERMELEHPVSEKEIKLQYKKLVKRYHPDMNQGNKEAEERFKAIVEAYQLLSNEYTG